MGTAHLLSEMMVVRFDGGDPPPLNWSTAIIKKMEDQRWPVTSIIVRPVNPLLLFHTVCRAA